MVHQCTGRSILFISKDFLTLYIINVQVEQKKYLSKYFLTMYINLKAEQKY
jgi:hypothetical protein